MGIIEYDASHRVEYGDFCSDSRFIFSAVLGATLDAVLPEHLFDVNQAALLHIFDLNSGDCSGANLGVLAEIVIDDQILRGVVGTKLAEFFNGVFLPEHETPGEIVERNSEGVHLCGLSVGGPR